MTSLLTRRCTLNMNGSPLKHGSKVNEKIILTYVFCNNFFYRFSEIWDIEYKKSVATFEAADSTEVKWSPGKTNILCVLHK